MRTADSSAAYQGRFAPYGPALLYVVRYPLGYGVGFAIAAWLIAGVAAAITRHRKIDIILLSWLIPYFTLVTISPAKFMRYSAPLLPVLAVFGGVIVVNVLSVPARRVRLLAAVCAIGSVVYSSAYDAAYAGLFSSADSRSVATSWITKHVPRNAKIEFEQLPNGLVNLPYFVSAGGYHPCFAQFRVSALSGPVNFVAVDNYSLEDHARVDQRIVQRFRRAISDDSDYTAAFQVKQEPRILGLAFSIAGSPHDWRYPSHEITIYRHLSQSAGPDPHCYPSVSTAVAALYPPPARQPG
jgi:hypothetical protein